MRLALLLLPPLVYSLEPAKHLRSATNEGRRGLSLPQWFCSFFDGVAPNDECDNATTTGLGPSNVTCPNVQPLSNRTGDFDLANFTAHAWFVQKQQVNGFQPSVDHFFCLVHRWIHRTQDEYLDYVQYGTIGSVIGSQQTWDTGDIKSPAGDTWCSGQDEDFGGGMLRITPCILRGLLARVGIPMWVIAVASDYHWAIVSGGAPEIVRQIDPPLCTTRTNVSDKVLADTSGTGLWLMTRDRVATNETLAEMEQVLLDMGIFTGDLYPVLQEGCNYTTARLNDTVMQRRDDYSYLFDLPP